MSTLRAVAGASATGLRATAPAIQPAGRSDPGPGAVAAVEVPGAPAVLGERPRREVATQPDLAVHEDVCSHLVEAGAPGLTATLLTTIDLTRPVGELRQAYSALARSHEELKATQAQLVRN